MPTVLCVGMAVLDRIFTVPALPAGPTKLYATALHETGGGPASTAAATVVRLGGRARLFARVGADAVGDAIVAGLAREGVDVGGLRRLPGARSAWSAIAVDPSGERTILNFPGAGLDGEAPWITATDLAGVGAVLVDMGWPAGAAQALTLARHYGVPSVLDADLGPAAAASGLFGLADHVVFSAAGLTHHAATLDPAEGLRRMRTDAPDALLAVTLGAAGLAWLEHGRVRTLAAPAVQAVDTLGAGDVFHGAYALALAEGVPVPGMIRFANAAAALKCTRPGGRAGIPSRAEVDTLLSSG